MLKRMKKIYETKFYNISKEYVPKNIKERFYCYYDVNMNEDILRYNEVIRSNLVGGLFRINIMDINVIWWEDDGLGTLRLGKKYDCLCGTISKINNKKYFLLLRRMNFYA